MAELVEATATNELAGSIRALNSKPARGNIEETSIEVTIETRIVEALLFAATAPVSTDFLLDRLPEGTDVGAILDDIQNLYEGRGVNLTRVDEKWSSAMFSSSLGLFLN